MLLLFLVEKLGLGFDPGLSPVGLQTIRRELTLVHTCETNTGTCPAVASFPHFHKLGFTFLRWCKDSVTDEGQHAEQELEEEVCYVA